MGGQDGAAALSSVNFYNAGSDTWTPATSLPGYCSSCVGGISGNKIVVANGIDGTFVGTINPTNPGSITWIVGPDYPVAGVWGLVGAASLDQSSGLVIFTAGSSNFNAPFDFSEYTFAFDLNTNQWKVGPPKPTPVFDAALTPVVDNDSLYMVSVGGFAGGYGVNANEWLNLGPYQIPAGIANSDHLNLSLTYYPNPFINFTNIHFTLSESSLVKVVITDVLGKTVEVLCDENLQAGKQHLKWEASKYNSGIYFCRINVNGSQVTHKLVKY
jgi:hypothetical protein